MNKLMSAALAALAVLGIDAQIAQASNHHGNPPGEHIGTSQIAAIGLYATECFPGMGSAVAESRNVTIGSQHQQVAYLQAQNQSTAIAQVTNLAFAQRFKAPLTFTLANSTGDYLNVIVNYNLPNGNLSIATFYTPNSKCPQPPDSGGEVLTYLGNGTYSIPASDSGLPVGSRILQIAFFQNAANDCTLHTLQFYNVMFNGKNVPISSGSSSCVQGCVSPAR